MSTFKQYVSAHPGQQFHLIYTYYSGTKSEHDQTKIHAWGTLAGIMEDHIPCERYTTAYVIPNLPTRKSEVKGEVINADPEVDKHILMLLRNIELVAEDQTSPTFAQFETTLGNNGALFVIIRDEIPQEDLPT